MTGSSEPNDRGNATFPPARTGGSGWVTGSSMWLFGGWTHEKGGERRKSIHQF